MKLLPLSITVAQATLLSACAVTAHRGFYEGANAPSWSHSVEAGGGGANVYAPSNKLPFPVAIVFSTPEKDRIAMVINFPEESPIFANKDVVVAFDNGKRLVLEAQQSMVIDVSASDAFTITIPAFRLSGVDFPKLETAFRWNGSTKYYVRGIQ